MSSAAVAVAGRTIGQIGLGMLVLVGVEREDGPADAEYIAHKVRGLRIFEETGEAAKHLNRSVEDVVHRLRSAGLAVATGEFQAMMQVSLVNDGPVTLLLDSRRRV